MPKGMERRRKTFSSSAAIVLKSLAVKVFPVIGDAKVLFIEVISMFMKV